MTGSSAEQPEAVYLDAVLHPHRSLGPRGFAVLMAFVGLVSFAAGMAFALQGAWPVLGFFGLDVLLIYLAFRLNYRSGRLVETVRIAGDELLLRRVHPNGRAQRWAFHPYWVRVELHEENYGRGRIRLSSHGRNIAFASFLTPEEREGLTRALRDALGRYRNGAPAPRVGPADTGGAPAAAS